MAAIEGRNGRFRLNNDDDANVEKFSGKITADRVDVTTFEDQLGDGRTVQSITCGVQKCVCTIDGYVDSSQMPTKIGIRAGALLKDVFLFLHKTVGAGRRISMPLARVLEVHYVVQIKDKIMFSLNIESTGSFTEPS